MTTPEDDRDEQAPALPREAERRVVEDADARGIGVTLQGGEVWYVLPITLSPRGKRIAEAMDHVELVEAKYAAASRRVEIATRALETAEDADEIDGIEARLSEAMERRGKVRGQVEGAWGELAYHALRSAYRVTREDTDRLVLQRHFDSLLKALNGQDTKESEVAAAIALLKAVQAHSDRDKEGQDGDGPFASATASGGAGAS